MIPEELIHGKEGGVDTGRDHETGTTNDLIYDLTPFMNAKKRYQYYKLGNKYKF